MAWNNRHILWDNPDNPESGKGMILATISASASEVALATAFLQCVDSVRAKYGKKVSETVRWDHKHKWHGKGYTL